MSERMTPSKVLEEYDIVGRDIPKKLIDEIRDKFAKLELEGVHPWEMLYDEIKVPEGDGMEEEKIRGDRLWVLQACAEILAAQKETSQSHRITNDGLFWQDRIVHLETPEDFIKLFTLLKGLA